jgi:5-methylcytosine-specific restriction endonuclease McrA
MKRKWNGSNWIRKERRLAIYLRDGLACVYCGASVEDGATLSLDHVRPHSKDGGTASSNLVTCCRKCNSSRGNRGLREFCKSDHGVSWKDIESHVWRCVRRKPDVDAAVELLKKRNWSVPQVLNAKG